MSVEFDPAPPFREDGELLRFLCNTGFSVRSGCQEEFYFVFPLTGYHQTARQAVEAAMGAYELLHGTRWLDEWAPTSGPGRRR